MKQERRIRASAVVGLVLFQWSAVEATAQLGMDEQACRSRFGAPVRVQGTSNGVQTLAFTASNVLVEVSLSRGVVCRAIYRGVSGNETAVEGILADCSGGARWHAWRPPGRRQMVSTVKKWRRSDGSALAELDGTVLTVTSEGWNARSVEELTAAVAVPATPPDATSPVTAGSTGAAVRAVAAEPTPPQKVPAPRPKAPDRLPAKGDTRDDVLRLLNEPDGKMVMRGVEIMVYPWGLVWIRNGKVVSVE